MIGGRCAAAVGVRRAEGRAWAHGRNKSSLLLFMYFIFIFSAGVLAQSEACVLSKDEVLGSKPRYSTLSYPYGLVGHDARLTRERSRVRASVRIVPYRAGSTVIVYVPATDETRV